MTNSISFCDGVSNFIDNHRKLCVFSLGLAIVAYSAVHFGKRVHTWIVKPKGTTEKVQVVANAVYSQSSSLQASANNEVNDQLVEPEEEEKLEKEAQECRQPPPTPSGKAKWTIKNEVTFVESSNFFSPLIKSIDFFIGQLDNSDFSNFLREAKNNRSIKSWTITNLTHPHVYMPSTSALKHLAVKYFNKYEVLIHVSNSHDLPVLINGIDLNTNAAQYVGFIVSECEGHAISLIVFFGKKNPNTGVRTKQILIADTLGMNHFLFRIVSNTVKGLFKEIFVTTKSRQVDQYSCRTGAMQLLKRGLLALQNSPNTQNLSTFLNMYATLSLKQDQPEYVQIEELPPEFDAAEQVSNKKETRLTVLDSRDKFSNNPSKKAKPRTIADLRNAHTEMVKFTCTFFLQTPEELTPPSNVSVSGNAITITATRSINTHLATKGQILSTGKM